MRCWIAVAFAVGTTMAGHALAADMVTKAPLQAAAAVPPNWTWTFDTQPQYVSWSGNRGWPNNVAGTGHGSQFYVPFGVALSGNPSNDWRLDFVARGGYVEGRQTVGPFGGSVSTATDTTLSATATLTSLPGWQPFVTMQTNLPTGMSLLANTRTWAHMDPDLVPIAVYGEGLNYGPTVGVTVPVNAEFSMVASGGITWRGAYWKEGGFDPATMTTGMPVLINPSAVYTGTFTATWVHDNLTLQGSASYAEESINYADHVQQYRAGARTTISGSASYAWDQWWTTSVDGYYVHINKNEVPSLLVPLMLVPEGMNSNNDIYRINASHMYKTPFYGGTLTVGPVGSFTFREHNAWDPTSFMFVPAKRRYSVGASAAYAPGDKFNIVARVEHIWINEDIDDPALIPVVDGQGWQASLALTLTTP